MASPTNRRSQIKMWSKGPFSRSRRPIGNPTPAMTSDISASADPAPLDKCAKDLPALPNASSVLLPQPATSLSPSQEEGAEDKRHSAVSPVGSPAPRDSGSSFCVSPIEESEQPFRHEDKRSDYRASANVPLPQTDSTDALPSAPNTSQAAPKTVQFAPHSDQSVPVRWDDYSGEPTTNNTGKASQVNSRNTTFHKSSGSHASNFLLGVREQLQTKKKLAQARNRISSFSKSEPPVQKETRGRSPSRVLPSIEYSGNGASTRDASPKFNNNLGFVPTTVTTITAGGLPKALPERQVTEYAYSGTRREQSKQRELPAQREQPEIKLDLTLDHTMPPFEPAARFDAVQPAMSANGPNHSPNDSPRESFHLGSKSTDDLPSVMSRRRPIPISMPGVPISKKPARKPTPAEVTQEPPLTVQNAPEEQPKDPVSRIESLDSKRTELGKRRNNLETVIHELTRVIQPSSFAYDMAVKAEVKKSVQSIENEIAEIKREEHELGLKIARAWRRLDEKENNGDGSNLWIKRVTS
ncbi:hypothetical protein N7532_004583 [Penicillium argentinense]|uniref:Uncharacterized protein n=1 Tax=Penicillium argentinense TaxID=1131581 RepID=A0A9W9KF17_9EURO|nr:uncharacterized protein N7532_004583 [Penicillium argentinense]KAJ5104054.1 hypothetical protein N7532_004583 [Penicillium argentinense]